MKSEIHHLLFSLLLSIVWTTAANSKTQKKRKQKAETIKLLLFFFFSFFFSCFFVVVCVYNKLSSLVGRRSSINESRLDWWEWGKDVPMKLKTEKIERKRRRRRRRSSKWSLYCCQLLSYVFQTIVLFSSPPDIVFYFILPIDVKPVGWEKKKRSTSFFIIHHQWNNDDDNKSVQEGNRYPLLSSVRACKCVVVFLSFFFIIF